MPLSLERIVEQDPDVIVITPMGDVSKVRDHLRQNLASSRAWPSLTAAREGKVYYLPDERFPETFDYPEGTRLQASSKYSMSCSKIHSQAGKKKSVLPPYSSGGSTAGWDG